MEMDRSDQDNTGSASLEEILWQLAYQCWQTQFATELDMAVALFEGRRMIEVEEGTVLDAH